MTIDSHTQVLQEVRQMLAHSLDIEPEALLLNAKLEHAYGIDSTELTQFAKQIEQRFALSFSKSERDDWLTAQNIMNFVEKKMREKL